MDKQLIFSGLLHRRSQHRKVWHLRGILIYLNQKDEIFIEIVKQIQSQSFSIQDILDISIFQLNGFLICVNIHLEELVITFGVKDHTQLETFYSIIVCVYFSNLNDNVLQNIFRLSIVSLMDDTEYLLQKFELFIPRIGFDSMITKCNLIQVITQYLMTQIQVHYNIQQLFTQQIFLAIFILFKILFQIIIFAFSDDDINPGIQLLADRDIELSQLKEIIFINNDQIVNVYKYDNQFAVKINVILLPNILLLLCQQYNVSNILEYIQLKNQYYLTVSLNLYDILNWVQFSKEISAEKLTLIEDIKKTILSSYQQDYGLQYLFQEKIIDKIVIQIKYIFKFSFVSINVLDNSIYSEVLHQFLFLPDPSKNINLYLNEEYACGTYIITENGIQYKQGQQQLIYVIASIFQDIYEECKIFIKLVNTIDNPQYNFKYVLYLDGNQQHYQICVSFYLQEIFTIELSALLLDRKEDYQFRLSSISSISNFIDYHSLNKVSIQNQRVSFTQLNVIKNIDSRLSFFKRISYQQSVDQKNHDIQDFGVQFKQLAILQLKDVLQVQNIKCNIKKINYLCYHHVLSNNIYDAQIASLKDRIQIVINTQSINIMKTKEMLNYIQLFQSQKLFKFLIAFYRVKLKNIFLSIYTGKLYVETDDTIYLNYIKVDEYGKIKLVKSLFNLV
ncbi:hypothetical protein SS50377_22151 [Spironucleus salmonicida]|uniref:Transmembrane protein n=1 Tax=Spironucleus salmonicida TaxID=348837 RepID=V6LM18_9EUKA|nr:hypothetical protein SS50377_22151 [Spironucleus salmonicida]|eukprot:EST45690.1 Hypothetical protein SS50377_jh012 [Spironucleus salmonicida]